MVISCLNFNKQRGFLYSQTLEKQKLSLSSLKLGIFENTITLVKLIKKNEVIIIMATINATKARILYIYNECQKRQILNQFIFF